MPASKSKYGGKPDIWKALVVESIGQGISVRTALEKVQITQKSYEYHRANDPAFVQAVDEARAAAKARRDGYMANTGPQVAGGRIEYSQFSEHFLGTRVFPHHQNMIDLVEGRELANLHPAMTFEEGAAKNRRVLINVPPNHAKSMVLSVGYVTYRICLDPNINILLISKTQEFAKKLMFAVKQRLTHPKFAALQAKFGPADGYKASADQWTANKIYLGADQRDSDSKDPTLEAIGMEGQIYGARADLILLDDTVTLSNAAHYENQASWIRQEVASRIGPGGQIVVVGTRVASMDLYRHLRDPDQYTDGLVPWSYLAMPAVLEYQAAESDWRTLWPVSDEPFVESDEPVAGEGRGLQLYPRWTGQRLAAVRNEVGPRKWSLVYQQADVAEDATFDPVCVRGAINPHRHHGVLPDRTGWHVVMGVDPAIAGQMGLAVCAGNRSTGEFMLLTVESLVNPTPAQIRELIVSIAERYRPDECLIEDNAFQGFLAQDEALTLALANLGVLLKSHHTGANKTDPDFGVASMAALFGTRTATAQGKQKHNGDATLSLPNVNYGPVKTLVEELVAWNPEQPVKRRKQDLVMALWFTIKRLREIGVGAPKARKQASFARSSSFLSARDRERQVVVNLNDWAEGRGA